MNYANTVVNIECTDQLPGVILLKMQNASKVLNKSDWWASQ